MNSSQITRLNIAEKRIYVPADLPEMLDSSGVRSALIKGRGIEFYNCPCSFDIETYSFYQDGEKACIMYEWTLSLNGLCMIGRTWEEFSEVFRKLISLLDLSVKKRLIIFVHNLSYEFQFIKDRFFWKKVFAVEVRKPVYAISVDGIEFRCSYLLSGYSLAQVAKQLGKQDMQKLDTLDYALARHSGTYLSEDEKAYCVHDVQIVVLYIDNLLKTELNIMSIPITKTGFVRRFCRKQCFYESDNQKNSWKKMRYNDLMSGLTLTVDEYNQLKRAFQGGFTHANAWHSGKVIEHVMSKDETSAYPCVMIAEQYPMSSPENVHVSSIEELRKYLDLYCCCFDVEFTNIEAKVTFDNYISVSRCWDKSKVSENNGRLIAAGMIKTTITEQDWFIIEKAYSWSSVRVANLLVFRKGFLPRDFVKAILTLYGVKTKLKGVTGMEREYLQGKEMLNSTYGMTVTDIVRDQIEYIADWTTSRADKETILDKYNSDANRFLYYPWGVWVTAYARRRLWNAIFAVGDDYVYSDTDSCKFMHPEAHEWYFEQDNELMKKKLELAMKFHHLDFSWVQPETVKGEKKLLGLWDDDGLYDRFKALRAKCYLVEEDGDLKLTVAGLNKKVTVPYMIEQCHGDHDEVFRMFSDGLIIPPEFTGKNTHTYCDRKISGELVDYQGNRGHYEELSFIHLEAGGYDLSLTEEYKRYILTFAQDEDI